MLQIARARLRQFGPIELAGYRFPPAQLAIAAGGALMVCAALAAVLVFPRTSLPPRAPSPIVWSFDAGLPLLLTKRDRHGVVLVEAVVVSGENRSKQTLQKVAGTLRSQRSNLSLHGILQLAENPSPELLAFDVPPGSQFDILFSLPRGENPRAFIAAHGGLSFTFRYSVEGMERSLFQHIPATDLEAEIPASR